METTINKILFCLLGKKYKKEVPLERDPEGKVKEIQIIKFPEQSGDPWKKYYRLKQITWGTN